MNEKKVSIIIPVYNGSKYIDECLSSVVNQTYKNLEIIIIDDGSTDNSVDIIKKWSTKDNRIVLYENENHGVSYTRNFGIQKSSGYFIAFVDCDDVIDSNFISYLTQLSNNTGAECVVSALSIYGTKNSNSEELIQILEKPIIQCYLIDLIEGYIGGKLFHSRIIKENRIYLSTEIFVGEDLLFNFDYSKYCSKVAISNQSLYFYRIHGTSAFNNLSNLKWFSLIKSYDTILAQCNEDKKTFYKVESNLNFIICEAKYRIKQLEKNGVKIPKDILELKKRKASFNIRYGLKQCIKILIFRFADRKSVV